MKNLSIFFVFWWTFIKNQNDYSLKTMRRLTVWIFLWMLGDLADCLDGSKETALPSRGTNSVWLPLVIMNEPYEVILALNGKCFCGSDALSDVSALCFSTICTDTMFSNLFQFTNSRMWITGNVKLTRVVEISKDGYFIGSNNRRSIALLNSIQKTCLRFFVLFCSQ